jgi:hypothetical protein
VRRLAVLTILSLVASLTVAFTSSSARSSHPRKHHSVRCRASDVRIKRHHKTRCVPASRMPRLAHANQRALLASMLTLKRVGKRRVNTSHVAKQAAAALSAALDRAAGSSLGSAHMNRGRSTVRAADAGPTVGGWQTTIDPGNGDGPVTVDARKGDSHLKLKEEDALKLTPCPDGAGKVPAKRTFLTAMDGDIPIGHGLNVRIHYLVSEKGNVVGHTTDDADFKDLDLEEHYIEHLQVAVIAPNGKVIATNPPLLYEATMARSHVLPGTDYSPELFHGVTLSEVDSTYSLPGAEPSDFDRMIGWLFYWTIRKAANTGTGAYLLAAHNEWERCITVSVAPAQAEVRPGQSLDVTVTAQPKVRSSTPVKIAPSLGILGTVTPAQATAMPGQAVRFTYTAPSSASFADSVAFNAVSRQGKGFAFADFRAQPAPSAYQYDVNLTGGNGSYQEDDSAVSGSDSQSWSFSDTFNFTSSWQGVIVPLAGAPAGPQVGASGGNLSGSVDTVYDASNGTDTAHYHCTAPLTDTNSQSEFTQNVTPGNGTASGTPVSINGWTTLLADNPDQSCTQSGFFTVAAASAGGAGQTDLAMQNAYTGTVTVTPAQLAEQQFSVSLDSPALTPGCTNASGTSSCSHTLTWHATVTFTKTGQCSADQFGNYTCKPL